jgi:hypothetical protein
MHDLAKLAADHPLRNTALADIGAEYRPAHGRWLRVDAAYGIARSTYNELAAGWRDRTDWRAP